MIVAMLEHKWISNIIVIGLLLMGGPLILHAQDLQWQLFNEAMAIADSANKHILVDVSAPWCGWCQKMEGEVYPKLKDQLNHNFVVTNINRDNRDASYRYNGQSLSALRLSRKFNANKLPTIAFLKSDGTFLFNISGFIKAQKLKPLLQYVSTDSYRHMNFKDFKNRQASRAE